MTIENVFFYLIYIYIYIYISISIYIYIYIYLSIYLSIYICKHIYKRTSPTGFFIQWRSFVCTIYIMCPSGHLTSARFEHFVCRRYIWYIFSLVCSVSVIQSIYHAICLIRPSDGRSTSVSFETVSLNILVHDVINSYIYIYMRMIRSNPKN